MALSCIISELKRYIGRKLRFFSYPTRTCAVLYGKTRMVWLRDCEKKFEDSPMFTQFDTIART